MVKAATALVLLLLTAEVRSEIVDVKYRGPVDLKTFECRDINRSSFIQRVCYDKPQRYIADEQHWLDGVVTPIVEKPPK
jgi:hypothetical protein